MIVLVNHKEVVLDKEAKLISLLEHLQLSAEGIALAVDNCVIPKTNWTDFELKDQMKVTLIRATQGG